MVGARDLAVAVAHAVDDDLGVRRVEVEEQALDRNAGIVDRLRGRRAELVAHLAAVAVDAVADAVEEAVGAALDRHRGQIFQIFFHRERRRALFLAEIMQEIVSAADAEIEQLVRDADARRVVDEAVERAVAAAEHHVLIRRDRAEEILIIGDFRHIMVGQRRALQHGIQPVCLFLAVAVARVGVEQNMIGFHGVLSLSRRSPQLCHFMSVLYRFLPPWRNGQSTFFAQ